MNNPCETCQKRDTPDTGCDGREMADNFYEACGPYAKYLGYQEGLAESQKRIVEWFHAVSINGWYDGPVSRLEAWLERGGE